MWRSRYALGLEMSDNALKLAEVRIRSRSKPTVTRHAAEQLPAGAIEDGRIRDRDLVVRTLRGLVKRTGPNTRKAHVVLPGSLVMVRFLKLPDLPERRLRKVIEFELKHNAAIPLKTPHFDFVKLGLSQQQEDWQSRAHANRGDGWDGPGWREDAARPLCDVMVAIAPLEAVREYAKIVAAAGLRPLSIEIRPLSLYRLVTRAGLAGPDDTFLVADVGETVTDLSVFHDRGLRVTRIIPIRFAPGRDAEPESAAAESAPFPEGMEGSDAETAFRSACSDLAHEIERLMLFFRYSLFRDRPIGRIILTGDAPRLDGIARVLSELLAVDVRLADGEGFKLRATFPEKAFPAMAVPVGLALRGNRR